MSETNLEADTSVKPRDEKDSMPRLSIPVNSELRDKIDILVKENGTSITKLVGKIITDSITPGQGALADQKQVEPIDISQIEDSLHTYTRLVSDSSEAYLESLESANETLKVSSVNSCNSLRLSTAGLKNAVEEAEMTITQGSKSWNEILEITSSIKKLLEENLAFHHENKELRNSFKSEVERFKKQLTYEAHDYRKSLARFAVKTYSIGLCFMAITTVSLYFTLRYCDVSRKLRELEST